MENETIVTGKKLRRYNNGIWERMSFWHKAKDCEMENGNNLETEIQNIKDLIVDNQNDLKKQILIYNKDTDYYQGYAEGQWKDVVYAGLDWDGYLLKSGIENKNRNFELIPTNYRPNGVTYTRCLYDKNFHTYNNGISTIRFSRSGTPPYTNQRGAGTLYSLYPIDLTEYSQIKILADNNISWGKDESGGKDPQNFKAAFYLTRVINDGYIPEAEYGVTNWDTPIDCSNLNGSYYFAFYLCETAGSYVYPTIDIRHICLIK